MDLYRVNLNLLVALDGLLTEQSVTLAAKKIFISQAAMSNNLQQLRQIFKDELLIREKNHMILTSYARQLQPKLRQVLDELRNLVEGGQCFNPQTTQRTFNIGMSDYMATIILPPLLKRLEKLAPNIKIIIVSAVYIGGAEWFENGNYDLAIGKIFVNHPSVKREFLFKSPGVMIVSPKHPLAKKKVISLDDYLNAEHVAVCPNEPFQTSLIEETLNAIGHKRNIKVASPFIKSIFKLVEQSDYLVGSAVMKTAKLYQKDNNFIIKPLPFDFPEVEFFQIWHQRFDNDHGLKWLRQQILAVIE